MSISGHRSEDAGNPNTKRETHPVTLGLNPIAIAYLLTIPALTDRPLQ